MTSIRTASVIVGVLLSACSPDQSRTQRESSQDRKKLTEKHLGGTTEAIKKMKLPALSKAEQDRLKSRIPKQDQLKEQPAKK